MGWTYSHVKYFSKIIYVPFLSCVVFQNPKFHMHMLIWVKLFDQKVLIDSQLIGLIIASFCVMQILPFRYLYKLFHTVIKYDASYAINNASFVDLCLSSIVASYHLLSSIFIRSTPFLSK